MEHKTILRANTAVKLVALAIIMTFSFGKVSAQSGAPVKLKVTNASYRHSLAPQGNNTYGPMNMVDGDPATVWAVSLNNDRIYDYNGMGLPNDRIWGPEFEVKCKKLSHIVIRNGYGKSATAYINNSRLDYVEFSISGTEGGGTVEEDLEDVSTPQRIDIIDVEDSEDWNRNITTVQMIFYIDGIIEGAKWNDLCISEIEFWGWE